MLCAILDLFQLSRPILEVKNAKYIESWELMDHGDEAIDCACKIVIKPS